MKTISFSESWMVKAILEGRKTQTIRPLFCKSASDFDSETMMCFGSTGLMLHKNPHKIRLQKGDKVKLIFRQRSTPKDSWFCMTCGWMMESKPEDDYCVACDHPRKWFPKHFATTEITDAFKVTLSANIASYADYWEADGFNSALEMSAWFLKKYKNPMDSKPFVVYRWRLL